MKTTWILLASASALAIASTAAAQTAPAPATPAPAAAAPAPAPASAVGEVVVTGSRVIRNGNASPTPQTVVSADALLALQPGPVAEALENLPVFAGSRNAVGNPGTGVTNAAASELNLRYLGYVRTLVLYDGHRISPSTYDQIVDVAAIPQMLLQRVDTVTGGVSAVYGSDAVAGVVNFITDTKFNGLKFNVSGGISTRGDDGTEDVGIAVGQRFLNDKAHVEFSYEYHNDPGILNRSDRAWGQNVITIGGSGTTAAPYHLVQNTRFANYTFGGLVSSATGTGAALNGQTFAANGQLSPFVAGASTGLATYQSGGSGAYYDGSLKYALNTNKAFGRFDYDFTDDIHGYVSGSYSAAHILNYGQYNQITNDTFNGQNAYLPTAYQFTGTFKLSEFLQDAPRIDTGTQENQYFVVAGLDGKFAGDYHWNLAYSHSAAQSTTTNDNNINNQKLSAALDAVSSGGSIVCRAALTNSAYSSCVPLNLFGPTAANAAGLAYVTQKTQFVVNNGLDDVSGAISGSPFSDWAGPVTFAASGEWRNETFSVNSNALPTDFATCAGLMYNCTQGTTTLWADATLANRSQVSESVEEGALEAGVPLLKDLPFAQDVSFNGAIRYTNYSVSGSATTWKAGLVWQINDELKLRGTRSRDIRAPNLYDLYQPSSVSTAPHADNLTNTTPTTAVTYTSGNVNLKPEVGNTTTAGFVYSPKWLPRFSVSMDAYYIDVSNAIVSQSGYSQPTQAACYASGGSSPLCALIVRPGAQTNTAASNAVTAWYVEEVNANDIKTYGADFEANYAATVLDHPLSLRGLVTWQPHYITISPGVANYEGAGQAFATQVGGAFALPVIRVNVFADYKVGPWDFGLLERWRSAVSLEQVANVVYSGTTTAAAAAYTDLNLVYHLNTWSVGSADMFLNVSNLFDTQPVPAAGVGQQANVGTFGGFVLGDDAIGRYFTIGIRFKH